MRGHNRQTVSAAAILQSAVHREETPDRWMAATLIVCQSWPSMEMALSGIHDEISGHLLQLKFEECPVYILENKT